VLFIKTQQVQPVVMQSQQPWIMSQLALFPLVRVMPHPFAFISHSHTPIVMLHERTILPFYHPAHRHHPAGRHRAEVLHHGVGGRVESGQVPFIFKPPAHSSFLMVHIGTITMFGTITPDIPVPGMVEVVIPIPIIR
jgi:hypothetical protein